MVFYRILKRVPGGEGVQVFVGVVAFLGMAIAPVAYKKTKAGRAAARRGALGARRGGGMRPRRASRAAPAQARLLLVREAARSRGSHGEEAAG